jgi:hypothetical protein
MAALLPAASASAQSACGLRDSLVQELAGKYAEQQVAIGLAAGGHVMEIFANAAQEWTLIATRPDGVSCIVATGTHLSLVRALPAPSSADPA